MHRKDRSTRHTPLAAAIALSLLCMISDLRQQTLADEPTPDGQSEADDHLVRGSLVPVTVEPDKPSVLLFKADGPGILRGWEAPRPQTAALVARVRGGE